MTRQMSLVLAELQCFEHPNSHPAKLGSKQKIKILKWHKRQALYMYMNTIAALQILHVMLVPTQLYDLHYITIITMVNSNKDVWIGLLTKREVKMA